MNAPFLKKYYAAFSISLQNAFYQRASFLMDRARSITIIFAFYAFWSAIFEGRESFLGYSKSQMLTYVLGMNILRALVFSDKTWEIIREINTGRISYYLLKPLPYAGYSLARDCADKVLNLLSACFEVALALFLFKIDLYVPHSLFSIAAFLLAGLNAMLLYFLMSYAVSAFAFWSAESAGPRFCFELFLEFAAGAFFPLDVLPQTLQKLFQMLPFSSLIYFPLNLFLERAPMDFVLRGFAVQFAWMIFLGFGVRWIWQRGLRAYAAQGG